MGSDELAAGEKRGDLSGGGGGGDVVVFGFSIEEKIANRATGEVGEVACLVEAEDDFEDMRWQGHEEGESLGGGGVVGKGVFLVCKLS